MEGEILFSFYKRGFPLTGICWKIVKILLAHLKGVIFSLKTCWLWREWKYASVKNNTFTVVFSLQVYDGPTIYSRPIATYCGADPASFASSGSSMTIQFQSDSSVTGKGFLLEWYAVDASAATHSIARGEFSVCYVVKNDISSAILSFTLKTKQNTPHKRTP